MRASRQMALTPDLVAQVHRVLEDPGPDPRWTYHADEDYDALVQSLLASRPDGPDTWLFAYGSLIWKPELAHVEVRKGTARGWHRSFCFRIERFRGTKDQPGLMMSLDRGGQCQGVVFKLPPEDLEAQLQKLVRREITVKPPNNIPRWITVETEIWTASGNGLRDEPAVPVLRRQTLPRRDSGYSGQGMWPLGLMR